MTGCILNRFIVQVLFRQLSLFSRLVLTKHAAMPTNDTQPDTSYCLCAQKSANIGHEVSAITSRPNAVRC